MADLLKQLASLREQASADLANTVSDLTSLAEWEKRYLGPAGEITALLRGMGQLPADQRPAVGREANHLKNDLTAAWEIRRTAVRAAELESQLAGEAIDVTLPGRTFPEGTIHPASQMIDEVSQVLAYLGFETVFGPEVEIGKYNFDMLNIPANHPARDVWDTMIVDDDRDEIILRTHTSPMQARIMEQRQPPVRVIVPGRVFRFEAQDASHEWMFHQIEGLAVDAHITMADLKGVLTELARQLFGEETQVRFR